MPTKYGYNKNIVHVQEELQLVKYFKCLEFTGNNIVDKEHIEHFILHEYQIGRNVKNVVNKICSALKEPVPDDGKYQR